MNTLVAPVHTHLPEIVARSNNAAREHARYVTGDTSPEAYERWVRVNLLDGDLNAGFQREEENFLLLNAERVLGDLSEALREYDHDRPRGARESHEGAERRALLLEAKRLIGAAVRIGHAHNVTPAANAVR